jgi:pimeloyl-ACP methyl ester carboxylesterase
LPDGFVHYEFAEMNSGPVVVLVHGLSVSSFIWDYTYEYLKQGGYRVLRFDLYGRGYSARLEKEYYEEIFYSQLYQLLKELNLHDERLTLIGQSMGGIIVTHYCLRHQESVEKLVLIDTAGLPDETSPYPQILKVPFLGKRIFKSFGLKRIHDNATASLYNPARFPDYTDLFFEQAQYKGYSHAILSSLLHMPMQSMEPAFEKLANLSIPILIFWGDNDPVIRPSIGERLKSILPHAEFHLIDESGHHPHYEQAAQVNPILKTFIDSD